MDSEQVPEYQNSASEHPTVEQCMVRLAVEKSLFNKQRRVWEMYNYDRLTHEEIAKKLKITRSAVTQQIGTIEKQIVKWIANHKEVYETMKYTEGYL